MRVPGWRKRFFCLLWRLSPSHTHISLLQASFAHGSRHSNLDLIHWIKSREVLYNRRASERQSKDRPSVCSAVFAMDGSKCLLGIKILPSVFKIRKIARASLAVLALEMRVELAASPHCPSNTPIMEIYEILYWDKNWGRGRIGLGDYFFGRCLQIVVCKLHLHCLWKV